jgi:hypothetical protein
MSPQSVRPASEGTSSAEEEETHLADGELFCGGKEVVLIVTMCKQRYAEWVTDTASK